MLEIIPEHWGGKLRLHSATLTNTRTGPNSIRMKAEQHCVLVHLSTQARRHVSLNSDHIAIGTAPVGSLEIIPPGSDLFARWDFPKECLFSALSQSRIHAIAQGEFNRTDFEWHPPRLGLVDNRALEIARNIRHEMQSRSFAAHDCVDAWLTILCIHLMRNYSNLGVAQPTHVRGGMSMRVWRQVDEYIRANLDQKITIEQMAGVAQTSPSHFARVFRQACGKSPHQYLIDARLEQARQQVLHGSSSFQAIATNCGFSSTSHMAAMFKRFWGLTPTDLRRSRHQHSA